MTWHHINAFNAAAQQFLISIPKGSLVYVEGHIDVREPDPLAEPSSQQAQRSIFYRHGKHLTYLISISQLNYEQIFCDF